MLFKSLHNPNVTLCDLRRDPVMSVGTVNLLTWVAKISTAIGELFIFCNEAVVITPFMNQILESLFLCNIQGVDELSGSSEQPGILSASAYYAFAKDVEHL